LLNYKMARNKPIVQLKVKIDKDQVLAVSEEIYPYMETDGYNTKVTREMEWDKEKLVDEIKSVEEELENKDKEIKEDNEKIQAMNKELDEIKKLRQWKQVKDNWTIYSKVYGGIIKENKILKVENDRNRKHATVNHEKRLLDNYREVLEKMKENEKDN